MTEAQTINGIHFSPSVRLSVYCESECNCLMTEMTDETQGYCYLIQKNLEHGKEGFFAVCDGADSNCGNER